MPWSPKVLVLLADDGSPMRPSVAVHEHVVDTGPSSIRRFWEENLAPYLNVAMTVVDVGTITPPAGTSRDLVISQARAVASTIFAVNLADFDHTFVIGHGLAGYEFGGDGRGNAFVHTTLDHTTLCHEFGHLLYFDHPWGRRHLDGTVLTENYGSPYCVMGAVSEPYCEVDPADVFSSAAPDGHRRAGPMVARATVHYFRPAALEETGKVVYVWEPAGTSPPAQVPLWAAGRGGPGQPELLVFFIDGDLSNARRRLYVEYRQAQENNTGPARWDAGLSADPRVGDATGVVVHTVEEVHKPDGEPGGFDRPHYRGTVSLAGSDLDLLVIPPEQQGSYVVEVIPPAGGSLGKPDRVEVKVGRNPTSPPKTWLETTKQEEKGPDTPELRQPPFLPSFLGPFEYRSWLTTTTWTISARSVGQGSTSDLEGAEDLDFYWMVAGMHVPGNGTEVDVPLPGGLRLRAKTSSSATAPDALVVWNPDPLEEGLVCVAHATAYVSGSATLDFSGRQGRWSDDLHRLKHWWDLKFEHPYTIPQFGPPEPDPFEEHLERLRWAYRELERTSPALAGRVEPLMVEEERVGRLRRLVSGGFAWSRLRGPIG